MNCDDGFSLSLTNGTDVFYADNGGTGSPSDTLSTFEITTPGMYRVRPGCTTNARPARRSSCTRAAGTYTAWSDAGFSAAARLVGDVGGLGTSLSNLAMVSTYQANVPVTSLADADLVVQDESLRVASTTEYRSVINMTTSDDEGRFGASETFPGLSKTETDDFVVRVQGTVTIPTAGAWTFAVGCDDGFRLTIYGRQHAAIAGNAA